MNRLAVYFGRLVVILAGFLAASLGASAFLHLLILGGLSWTPEEAVFVAGSFLFSVPFVALFVGYFMLLPAMVAIVIAEMLGRRDWLYFALAGAASGLAVVYFHGFHSRADGPFDPVAMSLVFAAAGAVGGICYWLVAGRGSGRWMEGLNDPSQSGQSGF